MRCQPPARWVTGGAVLGLACLLSSTGCQPKAAPPAAPPPPEVIVAHPVTRTITDFEEYTGRMAAVKLVDLRARVSGYLDQIEFTDGSDIAEGDPLFQIDPRPFAAALAQAEATEAQLAARLEGIRRQEARIVRLAEQKVTTADELDVVQYQRMEAEAELKASQAAVELAELNMEFTRVKSPISGRISRRLVDAGNLILADTTPLATIVSLDPVYAYFDVDERTVLQVRRLIAKGEVTSARDKAIHVELSLADDDDFSLKGTVNFVDNQVSPTTGTLRLRAEVENPRKLLAPGMFVRVKVPIGIPHDAVLVQEEALGSDQGQRFVYVLDDDNKVQYRRIKAGRLNSGLRIVNEGLQTSDRVVVSGLQRVRPGVTVRPKFAEAKPSEQTADMGADDEILVSQPADASQPVDAVDKATAAAPAVSSKPTFPAAN